MKRRKFLVYSAVSLAGLGASVGGIGSPAGVEPPTLAFSLSAVAAEPTSSDAIRWRITRAYQRMVAWAEGTWIPEKPDLNPYTVTVGYGSFSDFSSHPQKPYVFNRRGDWSDAAGAYQIISPTWKRLKQRHAFWYPGDAFSPQNQDLAFIYLHEGTGGHRALAGGSRTYGGRTYVEKPAFDQAIFADSREWASLPGHNIGASTGQRTKPLHKLWSRFCWELNREQGHLKPTVWPGEALQEKESGFRGDDFPGVTYLSPPGSTVISPESGRCLGSQGSQIVLRSAADPFRLYVFDHLSSRSVLVGDWLAAGQPIGLTSQSVFLQVLQAVDPSLQNLQRAGPVDPEPYLKLGEYFS